ncbi:acetyl-CoA synthetase-like protein [Thozetella sp. PMI_491]|nr:acetyl-CoA synthetase-like protein [Thozetella sp. PMI_491]
MALVAAAAGAAAATAASFAYLDARFHLQKDLKVIRGRDRVRAEWAKAVRDKRTSLYYFFEKRAAELGDREAIWSRAGCYSWNELLLRGNQYANWFLAQGVRPGDLVSFFMINSPDFIFAWVGLWAVGAAPAMINYNLTGKALEHCLKIAGAKLALVDGDQAAEERIGEVRPGLEQAGMRFVNLREVRADILAMPSTRPADELREEITATSPHGLFYTSGTTGLPKAVALPVIAGFGHGIGKEVGTNPVSQDERYYVCMPYYHGTGGINAMAQLTCGTTLCIAPKFSASGFWKDIRDSRATWFVYVGETLRYLLSAPPSPLDKQHNVHSVYGNGLRPDVWNRFKERFGITQVWEFFNSSEGMLALDNPSKNDWSSHAVGHHGLLQRRRYHKHYVPVAIDTDTGDILRDPKTGWAMRVPYEIGGEILVGLPFERHFPGYWNNPEATEKKYIRDVFQKGDCYYRTGDALRRDTDGRWYFLDRLGDTFRWKGENVSTAEVSEVLGRYPGVLDANVYGVQLPGHDGKAGAAAIYIDPAVRTAFNYSDFLKHARSQLPKYAVPVFLRHVKEPSSTHNNKQNKVPLKKDGVHPEKVGGDQIYWVDGHGKGSTYVPFETKDWDHLHAGKAKL